MISEIHDSLREQGLVPPAEDLPFIACSTDYRWRLEQAPDGHDLSDRVEDLEYELKEALTDRSSANQRCDEYEKENDELNAELEKLEKTVEELEFKLGIVTEERDDYRTRFYAQEGIAE